MRRVLRAAFFVTRVALVVVVCPAPASAGVRELVVVQANVGNVNVSGCRDQVFKLCLRPVEERGAAALRSLSPDLVGFQEILPAALCERAPSTNPTGRSTTCWSAT